jgi:uncharacterized protein DUF6934
MCWHMKYEMYTELLVSSDFLVYEFSSIGPKGIIPKMIKFSPYDDIIYNLAFGTKDKDDNIDDLARDNNNDRDKILATIVFALRVFFDKYPNNYVYFTGSTRERTRLYRMAITNNIEELNIDFEITGTFTAEHLYNTIPFEKGVNFFGFLVRRKIPNFKLKYKIVLYEPESENRGTTNGGAT